MLQKSITWFFIAQVEAVLLLLADGLYILDTLVDTALVEGIKMGVGCGDEVLAHQLGLDFLVHMQLQLVSLPYLLH